MIKMKSPVKKEKEKNLNSHHLLSSLLSSLLFSSAAIRNSIKKKIKIKIPIHGTFRKRKQKSTMTGKH